MRCGDYKKNFVAGFILLIAWFSSGFMSAQDEAWTSLFDKRIYENRSGGTLPYRLLKPEFPQIDPDRLYITGLSMGGFGTWDAIQRKPDLFAAAVPICGGGDVSKASHITKIPIWVFHGAEDNLVNPKWSRDMVEAIKRAGGNPKYTEYPGVGHHSWVPAYSDPELFEWLFSQKKKKGQQNDP